ncbi:MAG: hypothetical protein AAF694_09260 [Bacteroidota bacterium]
MFDPTPVAIMGVIFSGVIGIIWMSNRAKLAQIKAKAYSRGNSSYVDKDIEDIRQENRDLRRRIEILEAIVVDADMKLMTGLESELERRDEISSRRQEEGRDSDIAL